MSFPPQPLTAAEIKQIERLMDRVGESSAAEQLAVDSVTMLRAVTHRKMRPSILQCLRSRLRELASEDATRP
jgi:hypothetical protein